MGRSRRAEPLEHGRHEVGGVVGPCARSRRNPGSLGDEPAMGRVVARAAGGQLPALGPADLAELVGDDAAGRPHRARRIPQHDQIGKKAAARRGGGDQLVHLDRAPDHGLAGVDVAEASERRVHLGDHAIGVRGVYAALLLPPLEVEADVAVVVHGQGEVLRVGPVVHATGPQRDQRLVPGVGDAAGHLAHQRPRQRLPEAVQQAGLGRRAAAAAVDPLENARQELVPAVVGPHAVKREHDHARVGRGGVEHPAQGFVGGGVAVVQASFQDRTRGPVQILAVDLRQVPQIVRAAMHRAEHGQEQIEAIAG